MMAFVIEVTSYHLAYCTEVYVASPYVISDITALVTEDCN